MSVTPTDFLESAIGLSSLGQDEMNQRNVLSRAYYAAYHRSCEFIQPEESAENVGMHKRYINQLMKGDNGSIERKVGGKIKSMYSRRHIADYRLEDNISHDAVAIQLNAAKELFTIIERAKNDEGAEPCAPPSQPTIRVVK